MIRVLPRLITIMIAAAIILFPTPAMGNSFSNTITIPVPPELSGRYRETISTEGQVRQSVHTSGDGTTTVQLYGVTVTPTEKPVQPTEQVTRNATYVFPTSPNSIPTITRRVRPTATPRPTRVPTPTSSATMDTPTSKPASVAATPTPLPSTDVESKRDFMMHAINTYRQSLGLSVVKISDETCAFAKIRAKEIASNFSHAGFQSRINTDSIPYSHWSSITENIAMTSNYKDVVNMWIKSSGHAANMRKDTPFVCVEDYGNYYAYEGMRP